MNRRNMLGLMLVTAEGAVLPTVALADPTKEKPGDNLGLKGRVFRWSRDGYSWAGKAKQDLRRVALRIWVVKPGWNEATEALERPEALGTWAGFSIRFYGGPKLGGLMHSPGVYEENALIQHLAQIERCMDRSLMYYNLLGTTDNHEAVAARIAERYPGPDEWAKACWQWKKDNEWPEAERLVG